MVHALQRAGDFLRRGGTLISIRPHRRWRPAIAIVSRNGRLPVVSLINPQFERNLQTADAALERVVAERRFRVVGVRSARFRVYLDRPSQMRTYLELINPPRPRFPRGSRARLTAMWERAAPGARIEVTEPFVMNVLRRR